MAKRVGKRVISFMLMLTLVFTSIPGTSLKAYAAEDINALTSQQEGIDELILTDEEIDLEGGGSVVGTGDEKTDEDLIADDTSGDEEVKEPEDILIIDEDDEKDEDVEKKEDLDPEADGEAQEWTDALAGTQNPGCTASDSLPSESGSYYLTKDVELDYSWGLHGISVSLDLKGHGIKQVGNSTSCIYLDLSYSYPYDGSNLTINDSAPSTVHKYTVTDGLATVDDTLTGSCATFEGGYITGGKSAGVYISEKCSFIMNAGTIIGNSGENGDGGGVYIPTNKSQFTMNGGAIIYNRTAGEGGGVLNRNGTFNMNGGSICHNTCGSGSPGGGVFTYPYSTLTISGDSIIQDNAQGDGTVNNLVLGQYESSNNAMITLSSLLGANARIGISLFSDSSTGVFTSGLSGNLPTGKTAADIFFSDSADYRVTTNGDGEAVLAESGPPHTHTSGETTEFETGIKTTLPTTAGSYYLKNDITITDTWTVPEGTTNLCLNGHVIKMTGTGSVIIVPSGSTLNLYDCDAAAGSIIGGNAQYGGGVFVEGNFTLHGGNITGNRADQGGGVYYNNSTGTFTMNGGSITNNTAESSAQYMSLGGGVMINKGGFVLNDGTISENKSEFGGGVYCRNDSELNASSPFTMNGGSITKNTASRTCGAIYIGRDGTAVGEFTITGGTISENSAASNVGAFSVSGQHDIKISGDVKITGNTVIGDTSNRRSNVCLYGGGKLTIADELTSGASIGVSPEYGVFTSGLSGKLPSGAIVTDVFKKDSTDPDDTISLTSEGEAQITNPNVHGHDGVVFTAWTEDNSLPSASGNYYLTKDVVITDTWAVRNADIKLCLNGHSISRSGGQIISIEKLESAGASLTLYDCDETEHSYTINETTGLATVDETLVSGHDTFKGGYITGGSYTGTDGGPAVTVKYGCSFTMNGGTIIGNSAQNGGGVFVSGDGTFTMNGGSIIGNTAAGVGAGVYLYNNESVFTMNGGSINQNKAQSAGGVSVYYGTFTMNGGEINNNKALEVGAVGVNDGAFTMTGGSICGNYGHLGAVYREYNNNSSITISGNPVIKGNIYSTDGKEKNLCLPPDKTITIGGTLGSNASIGVTILPMQPTTGVFTSGLSGNLPEGTSVTDIFKSDSDVHDVGTNSDGEAEIIAKQEWTNELAETQNGSGKTATNSLPSQSGSYYLSDDVELASAWDLNGIDVTLDFKGHGIKGPGGSGDGNYVVGLKNGANLMLNDSVPETEHSFAVTDGVATVDATVTPGHQTFTGGYITGGTGTQGCGVGLSGGTTFTMNAGTIIGNYSTQRNGGGVLAGSGQFTMNGGAIIYNKGTMGGGVSVSGGSFHMNGGRICNNTSRSTSVGGGVSVSRTSTITISGDSIIQENVNGAGASDNLALDNTSTSEPSAKITWVEGAPLGANARIGINFYGPTTTGIFTDGWSTVMGEADPNSYFSADNSSYAITTEDGEAKLVDHIHTWTYTLDDAGTTITAACGTPNCTVTSGLSLTISEPSDLVYSGEAKAVELSDHSTAAFSDLDIKYYKSLTEVPAADVKDVGSYNAVAAIGSVIVTVEFEITKHPMADFGADQRVTKVTHPRYKNTPVDIVKAPKTPSTVYTTYYSIDGGVNWLTTPPKADHAGSYTVNVKYVNENYVEPAGDAFTIEVEQIPVHKHGEMVFEDEWNDELAEVQNPGKDASNSLPSVAGTYYLSDDVTIDSTWVVPTGTTKLCLNGHTITKTGDTGSVIEVPSGATLDLYDCADTPGSVTGGKGKDCPSGPEGGGVYIAEGGTFNMYGGNITGNTAKWGGGVSVCGTFKLYGGTISGNKADQGGAIYQNDGTIEMSGGSIEENIATTIYGAMFVDNFSMTGGSIKNNASAENYGAFAIPPITNVNIRVSGDAKIFGNKTKVTIGNNDTITGGITNNVTVLEDTKLGISGNLSADASIGITMADNGDNPIYGIFTDGLNGNLPQGKTVDEIFILDTDEEHVDIGLKSGEAAVVKHYQPIVYDGITFTAWEETTTMPTTSGNYYLLNDVDLGDKWTVGNDKDVKLLLNGRVLKLGENGQIDVSQGSLSLYDNDTTTKQYYIVENPVAGGDAGLAKLVSEALYNASEGTKGTFNGGCITGAAKNAILVRENGQFTMNGGTLIGNTSSDEDGGGVIRMEQGLVNIKGGKIMYNTADQKGGAISIVQGTEGCLNITGGEISHNYAKGYSSAGSETGIGGLFSVPSNTILLSGNTVIRHNYQNKTDNAGDGVIEANICSASNPAISIGAGGLTDGADIGLYESRSVTDADYELVKSGATVDSLKYLHADNPQDGGLVVCYTDGETVYHKDKADQDINVRHENHGDSGSVWMTDNPGYLYHDGILFSPWTAADRAPRQGNYYLIKDIVITNNNNANLADAEGAVNLDLNGHGIRNGAPGDYPAYRVSPVGELNLYDSNEDGLEHYITLAGWRGTSVSDTGTESFDASTGNGTIKVVGGYITGGKDGGIRNQNSFNMYGGTIIGNTGGNGGGVTNFSQSQQVYFKMFTGKICYNYASNSSKGAGVYNQFEKNVAKVCIISGDSEIYNNKGVAQVYNDASNSGGGISTTSYMGLDGGTVKIYNTLGVGGIGIFSGYYSTYPLRIMAPLEEGTHIGQQFPNSGTDVFTSGWTEMMGADADPYDYFFTADTTWVIIKTTDELKYVRHTSHRWTYSTEGVTITALCLNEGCGVKNVKLTLQAPENLAWDGNAKAATFVPGYSTEAFPDATGKIKYYKGSTEVAAENVVEPGTYTAKVTYKSSWQTQEKTIQLSFTITKAPKPGTLTDDQKPTPIQDPVYKGGPVDIIEPPQTPTEDYVVKYSIDDGETYTTEIPKAPEPGTFTVKVKYTSDHYEDFDGDDITIVIPAAPSFDPDKKPAAVSGLVYTGSELTLVDTSTVEVPSGYTLVYAYGENADTAPTGEYTETVPLKTEPGTYYVWFKILGDAAHSDSVPECLTVTIGKAPAKTLSDNNIPSAKADLKYTGSEQDLVDEPEAPLDGYTVQYKVGSGDWSETIPQGEDADTYTVSVQLVSDHYETITVDDIVVTIAKADAPAISEGQKPTAKTGDAAVYSGDPIELLNAPANDPPAGYTIKYAVKETEPEDTEYGTGIPTKTDAGTYDVWFKAFSNDDNHENTDAEMIEVTITEKPAEVTVAPTAVSGLKYTGRNQELLSRNGIAKGGVLKYAVTTDEQASGDTLDYSVNIPEEKNSGTYYVWYKVASDANYSDTAPVQVPVTIAKGDAPASITDEQKPKAKLSENIIYKAEPTDIIDPPTETPDEYEVKYKLSTEETWSDNPPAPDEPGIYTVNVKYVSDNYEDFDGEDITVTITAAAGPADDDHRPTVPPGWPIFDGTPFPICIRPVQGPTVEGYVMKYALGDDETNPPSNDKYSKDIPETAEPGTYYLWYKYAGGPTQSDSVPECKVITIVKGAAPVLTDDQKPTSKTGLVYNGSPQVLVSAPIEMPYSYQAKYSIDNGQTWTDEIPTGTEAGSYTVKVKYVSDYYEEIIIPDITVTIAATTIPEIQPGQKPTVPTVTPVYTGVPFPICNRPVENPPVGTVLKYALGESGDTPPDPGEFKEDVPEVTDSGTYHVWYKFEGDEDTGDTTPVCIDVTVDEAPKPEGVPTENQKPKKTADPVIYRGGPTEIITPPTELPDEYEIFYSIDNGQTWTKTPPTPSEPGDYVVKTQYRSRNYVDFDGDDISVTIKAKPELTDVQKPKANDKTYAGEEIELLIAPENPLDPDHYSIRYATGKDDTTPPAVYKYAEEIPTSSTAGDFYIWYKYVGDGENSDTDPVCIHVTIAKGTLSANVIGEDQRPKAKEDLIYKGTPVDLVDEPTEPLPEDLRIKYSIDDKHTWTDEVPKGTEAGPYTVNVKYESDNYEDIIIDDIHVVIKAVPVIDPGQEPSVPAQNPVYSGDPIPVCSDPTNDPPEGYTLVYAIGNDDINEPSDDEFSENKPEVTDAGTYYVWYKFRGGQEDSDTKAKVLTVVVDKKEAPAGVPSDTQKPTAVDNPVYKGGPVTIINEPATDIPEEYGYDIEYSIDNGNTWTNTPPKPDKPGEYNVKVRYVSNNYEIIVIEDITVTVPALELDPDQKPKSNNGHKYTGEEIILVNAPTAPIDPTKYTYKYAEGTDTTTIPSSDKFGTEIPKKTDKGTYYTWYKVEGGESYGDTEPKCLVTTIKEGDAPTTSALTDEYKPAALTATIDYTGTAHVLVVPPTQTTLPEAYAGYVLKYSVDDGKTWTTDVPSGTDPGNYTIRYKFENPNKKDIYGTELTAKIKAATSLSENQIPKKKNDLEYTGDPIVLVDEPVDPREGYTIKYALGNDDKNVPEDDKFSDELPKGLNAGTYYVWYKAVPNSGTGDTVPRCIVVEIGRQPATIDPATLTETQKPHGVEDQEYKGEPIELVIPPTESIEGYEVIQYSTDNGDTWTDEIPKGNTPGTYTVQVKYVNTSGNHEDVIGDPITVKLTEEKPELTDKQKPQPKEGEAAVFTGGEIILLKPPVDDLPEGYTIEYALGDNPDTPPSENDFTPDIPKGKDAKDYYVWYIIKGDDTHGDIGPIVIVVTILPMPAPEITEDQKPTSNKDQGGNDPVYTGDPIVLVNAPQDDVPGYDVYYAVGDNGDTPPSDDKFSKTLPQGEDAGDYDIWFKIVRTPAPGEDPKNYKDSEPEHIVTTIDPAPAPNLTDDQKPTANKGEGGEDITYTGDPIDLVKKPETGLTDGYTMVYAIGDSGDTPPSDEEFKDTVPTTVDAGEFHVWYKAKAADSNHSDSAPACIDVTIKKAAHEYGDSYLYADVSPKKTTEGIVNLAECIFDGFEPTGGVITDPKGELFNYMSNLRVEGENFLYSITGDIPVGTRGTVVVALNSKNYTDINVHLTLTTKDKMDSVDMVVTGVQDPVFYTGKSIRMDNLTVYSAGIRLTLKKDYTVGYTNNKNAGTAIITVTGKGNYRDKVTDTFKILPLNISVSRNAAEAAIDGEQTDWFSADDFYLPYTGNKQKKTPKLLWNDKKVVGARNYTLSYYKPVYEADGSVSKDPEKYANAAAETEFKETYVIIIRAKDSAGSKACNFAGSRAVVVNILNDKSKVLMSKVKVTLNKKSFVYVDDKDENGEVKPAVTVKYRGKVYTENVDFKVRYEDNKSAGTGIAIVEAVNKAQGVEGLFGEKKVRFNLKAKKINKVAVTGYEESMVFDPSMKGGMTQKIDKLVVKDGAAVLHYDGEAGIAAPDYTVAYQNNTKAGKATLLIKGENNYFGTLKVKFKISKFTFEDGKDTLKITADKTALYSKAGAKPAVKVEVNGVELTEKADYKLAYSNNKKLSGQSGSAATVKITGKGSYAGTLTREYQVVPCEVKDGDGILVATVKDINAKMTSTSKLSAYLKIPTVKETATNKKLSKNKDFDKAVVYDICTDSSFDESKTKRIADNDKSVPFATYISGLKDLQYAKEGVYIKATVTLKNAYAGTITTVYHLTENSIKDTSYKPIQKTYTSKEIELITEADDPVNPDLVVYLGKDAGSGEKLKYGVDYEIVEGSYKNNIKKGTAKVTIRGIGKFQGTKVIKFKIVKKKL